LAGQGDHAARLSRNRRVEGVSGKNNIRTEVRRQRPADGALRPSLGSAQSAGLAMMLRVRMPKLRIGRPLGTPPFEPVMGPFYGDETAPRKVS